MRNESRAKMISELPRFASWLKGFFVLLALATEYVCAVYVLDDSVGLGRMFNGIGGLSGGGVNLQLLIAIIYIMLLRH